MACLVYLWFFTLSNNSWILQFSSFSLHKKENSIYLLFRKQVLKLKITLQDTLYLCCSSKTMIQKDLIRWILSEYLLHFCPVGALSLANQRVFDWLKMNLSINHTIHALLKLLPLYHY